MVSSVELLGWYADWNESRVSGNEEVMKSLTSLSKDVITTEFRSPGQWSWRQEGWGFCGTGKVTV